MAGIESARSAVDFTAMSQEEQLEILQKVGEIGKWLYTFGDHTATDHGHVYSWDIFNTGWSVSCCARVDGIKQMLVNNRDKGYSDVGLGWRNIGDTTAMLAFVSVNIRPMLDCMEVVKLYARDRIRELEGFKRGVL